MPLISERPIVRIEPGSMHTIETRNAENLFGLWSVFSKCSPAMEDGKRYENMAWRLWSRETFCCAPDHIFPPRWSFGRRLSNDGEVPELSSSVASDDSNLEAAADATASSRSNSSSRPDLRRHDSTESRCRGRESHITPINLEKVVSSIQEKRRIEPLSPLPAHLQTLPLHQKKLPEDTTPRPSSPPPTSRPIPESSSSTVATALGSEDMSPPVGSDVSTSTDLSSHSVVHGFNPGHISTSIRSSTNLNPTPILKNAIHSRVEAAKAEPIKKKAPMFTLGGGSSDEDNVSSFETSMCMAKRSSLSDGLRKPGFNRKTTSFKDEVITRTITDQSSTESEEAIESESEEDDSDNAIADSDDEEEDWEDEESVPSSMVDAVPTFPRIDSRPELRSHRSLLTTLMHEGDRAQGFQDAAMQNSNSRSTPAIRRSRNSNGPSTGNSPQEDSGLMMRSSGTRSKPIIMTTSNVHPPALSPRTTRRNMLQTELTQSLRQNLLWERQQKNATTNAVNKRQQSAVSIPALRRAATTNDIKGLHVFPQQGQQGIYKSMTFKDAAKNNNSYNDYFDQGLQEYHQKGW